MFFNDGVDFLFVHRFFSDIGDIAGVAEATIKQSYKLMYPKAASLFPQDFVFHTDICHLPSQ